MTRHFSKPSLLLIALLAATGCHGKKSPTPENAKPAAPAAVTEAAAPAAVPPPPSAAQAPSADGSWTGSSGEDLPFTFRVSGNQVSDVYASFRMKKEGGCTAFASFSSDTPATLNGKSFTAQGKNEQMNNHIQFTVNGTLNSDKEASGTIQWTGTSSLCGDIAHQANWTAKKDAPEAEDSADE